jgi:hypothetical protein
MPGAEPRASTRAKHSTTVAKGKNERLTRGKSKTVGREADQAARNLENGRKTEMPAHTALSGKGPKRFSVRVQELDTGRTSAGTKPDTRGPKIWTKKTAAGGTLKIEENTEREPNSRCKNRAGPKASNRAPNQR